MFDTLLSMSREIGHMQARIAQLENWRTELDKRKCKSSLINPAQIGRVIFTLICLIAAASGKISWSDAIGALK